MILQITIKSIISIFITIIKATFIIQIKSITVIIIIIIIIN
jgi:hypothetical protein